MRQTKITRYVVYGKLYLTALFLSFRWSSLMGRINGPRIILNSIPKSGTNLLSRTLMFFPSLRYRVKRTLMVGRQGEASVLESIKKIGRGEFVLAHLQGNKKFFDVMNEKNIKCIMMIRDPRQVVISHYKFVTYIDTTHYSHEFFKNLKDDNERLKVAINGADKRVEPIDVVLRSYEDWLTNENTLVVKYEDLVGAQGGGNEDNQLKVLDKIKTHLGVKLTDGEMKELANKIFSTRSPTFRSGKIDSWRKELTEEHKAMLKEKVGHWLVKHGYEKDMNW